MEPTITNFHLTLLVTFIGLFCGVFGWLITTIFNLGKDSSSFKETIRSIHELQKYIIENHEKKFDEHKTEIKGLDTRVTLIERGKP